MRTFCAIIGTGRVWLALAVGGLSVRAAAPPVAVSLGANAQALQAPARVAVDAAANCYVTDPTAGQVVVFDAFGRVTSVKQGFAGPLAIAVDNFGNIFLSEEQTHSVSVFDSRWNFLYKLGRGDGEFTLPNYIAFDNTNNAYVSDSFTNAIKVYSGAALTNQFGSAGTGNGEFDFPAGIAVSAGGEIFVVDQNNDRVQVFTLGGVYLRKYKFGGMLGPSGRKQGALLDNAGRLYVADTFQGNVKVYDAATGTTLSTIGTFGDAPGQLYSPAGLALDGLNRLRAVSVNNSRVEIFGLDAYFHLSVLPADPVVQAGTDVTFSVAAGGPGPFTYQWFKGTNVLSDGGNISGATNATLSLTGVTSSDSGGYSVVVAGSTNTFTSPGAALIVQAAPNIVTPPVSQIVAQGTNVGFTIAATGDSLVYQWSFNGLEMVEATTSTLQLTNAQPSDSGNYSVVVSNAVGTAASAAALSVLVPPSILGQPASQTVIRWDTVNLEVGAAGDSLAYQWYFNSAAIPGANARNLVLPNVQETSAGTYTVILSNQVGTAVSDAAQLTVVIPPPPTNAPYIDSATLFSDNTLQLSALAEPGHAFAVTASTNLVDWITLSYLVSTTGTIEFTDIEAPSYEQRFYRVIWVP